MKPAVFAVALMLGGAAIAQTTMPDTTTSHDTTVPHDATNTTTSTSTSTTMDHSTMTHSPTSATTTATTTAPASGKVVTAGNQNPERDARGVKVMSDPAVVPDGFNGNASNSGMGGPLVDPATGDTIAPEGANDSYPDCTAEVTDNCLQAYERGRSPQ